MSEKSPILVSVDFGHSEDQLEFTETTTGRKLIDWYSDDRPASLAGIKYALVWKIDPDLFEKLPDLEIIFSAGAGVDKIMANDTLPDLPIVRFVDHTLTTRMSEWVCLQCLMHLRQQTRYNNAQAKHEWTERTQPQASDIRVGIMGLGVLGQDAASKLKALGFQVNGWSRTKKNIDGLTCYDASETEAFLSQTDFLVGLLPLTPETTGFFDASIFKQLPKRGDIQSPVFINAGRGQSQVEADIISALKSGDLAGASLDVFETEPLPQDNPLWDAENVFITPHAAANSDIAALFAHVERQIERYENGDALENLVDRSLGY